CPFVLVTCGAGAGGEEAAGEEIEEVTDFRGEKRCLVQYRLTVNAVPERASRAFSPTARIWAVWTFPVTVSVVTWHGIWGLAAGTAFTSTTASTAARFRGSFRCRLPSWRHRRGSDPTPPPGCPAGASRFLDSQRPCPVVLDAVANAMGKGMVAGPSVRSGFRETARPDRSRVQVAL